MYHQLINIESELKFEKKVSERKAIRLDDKVKKLDKLAIESKSENEKLQYENKKMNEELIELREFKNMQIQENLMSPSANKLKRTIRGGNYDLGELNRKTISFFPPTEHIEHIYEV